LKVSILGASGRTGRELVKQALESGHDVTAFVRDPAKLKTTGDKLTVVQGDMLDAAAVERAVNGQDVVISALGSPGLGPSNDLSEGTRNIIAAMEKARVKRLIFESSIGIGDSRDHAGWFARKVFFPLVVKNVFADKEVQERLIMESSLDWIIVRPGRLTNGRRTGTYRHGDQIDARNPGGTISRADTAEFMLRQIDDDTYLRKTPGVSY
jgi:putative NADH-flavin reductase